MMKEITIVRIISAKHLDDIISMHQKLFEGNKLYGKLIYFDFNFKNYFSKVLTFYELQRNNFVFGIFYENEIVGFIHLKIIDNILFLNNIYVKEDFRSKGIGKSSLNWAIKYVKKASSYNLELFDLEVFTSNLNAFNFYRSLGLVIKESYNWYSIYILNCKKNSCSYFIKYDQNNFKSIYVNENKIGTIICDKVIMVHDRKVLNLNIEMLYIYKTKSIIKQNKNICELIESSARMSIPFDSLCF